MAPLREDFNSRGNWIFRKRGFLPLMLVAFVLPAFVGFHYPHGSHHLDRMWECMSFVISLAGLALQVIYN